MLASALREINHLVRLQVQYCKTATLVKLAFGEPLATSLWATLTSDPPSPIHEMLQTVHVLSARSEQANAPEKASPLPPTSAREDLLVAVRSLDARLVEEAGTIKAELSKLSSQLSQLTTDTNQ